MSKLIGTIDEVLSGAARHAVVQGDSKDVAADMLRNNECVDLSFCSPPYEVQRDYKGLGFNLRGQEWVDWAKQIYMMQAAVTTGLTAWVVEGRTEDFEYSGTPLHLWCALQTGSKAGNWKMTLRKPCIYARNSTPGGGGPDWLRNDYEWIICSTWGRLPWADNTARAKPPRAPRGGRMSNRKKNGDRADAKYPMPKLANPGNIISGLVGGGHMGSKLAELGEAAMPEWLADMFLASFCRPDGVVADWFCGSGTVAAVAELLGRRSINVDVRESECRLTRLRIEEAHQRRQAGEQPTQAMFLADLRMGAVVDMLADRGAVAGSPVGDVPDLSGMNGADRGLV